MLLAQHAPAVKIAGRRLSISSKPKHHTHEEPSVTETTEQSEPTDYPRPLPKDEVETNDEEAAKKRKHGYDTPEKARKQKEAAPKRTDENHPTRDIQVSKKELHGAAGRIAQPAGRELGG